MRRYCCFLLSLVTVLAPPLLRAEEIQLKDGTKVTGKLIAVAGDTLQVKTAYGDISVPRSQVVTIAFPENGAAKTAGNGAVALVPLDEELRGGTYTNRTAGFQLTFPSNWELAPETRKSNEVVASLKSLDEGLFFMTTSEKFSATLPTYMVFAETQYKSNLSGYENLGETMVQLDGRKGIRLVFHGKSTANQADLKFLVYVLPYEGRIVRLSFFTFEQLFANDLPIFEKIAASYHSVDKADLIGKVH